MEDTPIELHMKDGRRISFPAGTIVGTGEKGKPTYLKICRGELAPKLPCTMRLMVCSDSLMVSYLEPIHFN